MRAVMALEGTDYKHHSGVIQHFLRDYIKTAIFPKEYSKIITRAGEIRTVSDYDDFYIASRHEAEKQIEGARKICGAVAEYLSAVIADMDE